MAGAHAEISFDPDIYPPMAPTDGNRAILAELNGVNRDMGLAEMGELDARSAAPETSASSPPTSAASPEWGRRAMAPTRRREIVDIPSIFKQAKRSAILMSRLAKERRTKR